MKDEGQINFRDIIGVLYEGKLTILFCLVLGSAFAFAVSWLLPNRYTASAVVAVVSNKPGVGSGGLGGMATQLGGLASLAGLAMTGDSDKSETIAVLQSGALMERYIADHNLLPILFSDEWDSSTRSWKVGDEEKQPTLWLASEYFKSKVFAVFEDRRTGLLTLSVTWTNPRLAAEWVSGITRLTNDVLRNRAIEQSSRHIEYLNAEAEKTDIVQVRTAIYALLESEIKNVMLAKGTDEYALRILDPAKAPERKASPNRARWTVLGGFIGILTSLFFIFIRKAWINGVIGTST